MDIETLKQSLDKALARIADLEQDVKQMAAEIECSPPNSDDFEWHKLDYDPEELWIFLEDIGLDPNRLPSSVGERMDIRKRLESPIPDLSEKLEECQEQYNYLEQHYNRAWELGYDPITKDFYCRACSRAGRES